MKRNAQDFAQGVIYSIGWTTDGSSGKVINASERCAARTGFPWEEKSEEDTSE